MKLIWMKRSRNDLLSIFDYIFENNPEAARQTLVAIQNSVSALEDFPNMGRETGIGNTRDLVIPHLPYIVVYKANKDRVIILRVFHTSRKRD